jgi:hypothetical protein
VRHSNSDAHPQWLQQHFYSLDYWTYAAVMPHHASSVQLAQALATHVKAAACTHELELLAAATNGACALSKEQNTRFDMSWVILGRPTMFADHAVVCCQRFEVTTMLHA